MDNEQRSYSRLNRFEKRRKNTKWLSIFMIIGIILIVIFVAILVFSSPDDVQPDPDLESPTPDLEDEPDQEIEADEDFTNDDKNGAEEEDDSDNHLTGQEPNNSEIEYIDSDEENVEFSYKSTWPSIQTKQTEPHEITWEQTSQDWQEMMKAAELATGVPVDEMYYLWVSGNGPQSVIATFSNSAMDEHFRVYITWIEYQGWQPERVDMLYAHDQMHNFN
ncbi:YrrS family protein [Amphibacillus sp. MSJ-3]|uniref:YrrS family protein n=1 Tax=Amphibacillus sp. MSJ-3 TaxID=2841505 RepID=UPI001C0F126F|nr:YrrS family protein [Amphibacillus sp. MSJ-3]MBU5595310.1 YrrS family protein [Amphibacillus sp. MSJ-3]